MAQTNILEAVVDSLDAALAAERAGADRLELCAGLELGGLTPSPGLVELICAQVSIPVYVLVRPRGGNFFYSSGEYATVLKDAELLADLGAAGLVTGFLLENGLLDADRTARLMDASSLPLTFHRAFDRCLDPMGAAAHLAKMGVERILTSGQQATALAGAPLLAELIATCGEQIVIMPGGGVSPGNVAELKAWSQAREFHFSAIKIVEEHAAFEGPALGKGRKQSFHFVPDPDKVAAIREVLPR